MLGTNENFFAVETLKYASWQFWPFNKSILPKFLEHCRGKEMFHAHEVSYLS